MQDRSEGLAVSIHIPNYLLNTHLKFVRWGELVSRFSVARVRGRTEISIHYNNSLGRLETEFGSSQQRVELPVRKSKFDLHAAGINYQYAQ